MKKKKPFKCEYCAVSFEQGCYLRQHIRLCLNRNCEEVRKNKSVKLHRNNTTSLCCHLWAIWNLSIYNCGQLLFENTELANVPSNFFANIEKRTETRKEYCAPSPQIFRHSAISSEQYQFQNYYNYSRTNPYSCYN